jgi:hypothetical protein
MIKVIACLGGVIMWWNAFNTFVSVKVYNTWRVINPIKIETQVHAEKYGNSIARWLFPPVMECNNPSSYSIDYSRYHHVNAYDNGNEWEIVYSPHDWNTKKPGGFVGGLGGGGPEIHIDKVTGKINNYGLQK